MRSEGRAGSQPRLNILIATQSFFPTIGGLVTATHLLATGLAQLGHEVTVVVSDALPSAAPETEDYNVVYDPSALHLLSLVKWCNIFVHNGLLIRRMWPMFIFPRRWVIVHHMFRGAGGLTDATAAAFRRLCCRFGANVGVSRSIGAQYSTRFVIIPNPYDDRTFGEICSDQRDLDVVFLGSVTKNKGVFVLIEAIKILAKDNIPCRLSIVGEGCEINTVRREVEKASLTEVVSFAGVLRGYALARFLQRHRVMAVPSVWPEPFGIVALEGLASGCRVVASAVGGLPEAVGGCGMLVPPGDPQALADEIRVALQHAPEPSYIDMVGNHLRRSRPVAVAIRYIDLFSRIRRFPFSYLNARGVDVNETVVQTSSFRHREH